MISHPWWAPLEPFFRQGWDTASWAELLFTAMAFLACILFGVILLDHGRDWQRLRHSPDFIDQGPRHQAVTMNLILLAFAFGVAFGVTAAGVIDINTPPPTPHLAASSLASMVLFLVFSVALLVIAALYFSAYQQLRAFYLTPPRGPRPRTRKGARS